MFALMCELPSALCGWLRLINNNSSWLGRNNSPKTKRLWMKKTRDERDRRRRKLLLPALPSVLMSANWSFVTQIGADEAQRRTAVRRQHTFFILWRSPPLMCATSSALMQVVTAAGQEGFTGHNRSRQEEEQEQDTRALKWCEVIHIHAKITQHHTCCSNCRERERFQAH